jgi:hypothetical protein
MSAFVEAGARPLRIYAVVSLVMSAVFVVATVICALSISRTGTTVMGQGAPGQAITLSTDKGTGGLKVLAATAAGASTTTADSCRLSGGGSRALVSSDFSLSGATSYAGRSYAPFVAIGSGWRGGDTVTCTGPHLQALLIVRQDRLPRIALTALLALIAVGSGVFGLVGLALRRR